MSKNLIPTRDSRGQSLVETALVVPLLLLIVLNAINFGYYYLVALNLSAAPRSGVLYSIVGFATPGTLTVPSAGPSGTNTSVSYLTYQDMTGALSNPQGASVHGAFILQRVDVDYSFSPIIQGTPFGIALLPSSVCTSSGGIITCTFHRQVSMRAMD